MNETIFRLWIRMTTPLTVADEQQSNWSQGVPDQTYRKPLNQLSVSEHEEPLHQTMLFLKTTTSSTIASRAKMDVLIIFSKTVYQS